MKFSIEKVDEFMLRVSSSYSAKYLKTKPTDTFKSVVQKQTGVNSNFQ